MRRSSPLAPSCASPAKAPGAEPADQDAEAEPFPPTGFAAVEAAAEAIRSGKPAIVCEGDTRGGEGDVVFAAIAIDGPQLSRIWRNAGGAPRLALSAERWHGLGFEMLQSGLDAQAGPWVAAPVDARHGVKTGTSAADRATVIRLAASPEATPEGFVHPGHVAVTCARPGGVLERAGLSEAAVDLMALADLPHAAGLCEVIDGAGEPMLGEQLRAYGRRHAWPVVTVAQLIAYRHRYERHLKRIVEATLPTAFGEFKMIGYGSQIDGSQHVAAVMGDIVGRPDVLVRVHSACLLGDALGSLACPGGGTLSDSMRRIAAEGHGVIVYLADEQMRFERLLACAAGRHHGGGSSRQPVFRESGIGAQILADLGLSTIRLLTDNPKEMPGIEGFGLYVTDQLPIHDQPAASDRRP